MLEFETTYQVGKLIFLHNYFIIIILLVETEITVDEIGYI